VISTATNADLQTVHHFIGNSRAIFEFIWFVFNIMTFVFVWRTITTSPNEAVAVGITEEEMFELLKGEYGLSDREAEIARLLYAGKNNKIIAEELFLSPNTVKVHASNLYHKLGVTNRVEAVQLMSERKNGH
jgi:DNA-binding CsgD family transcriptional regulator